MGSNAKKKLLEKLVLRNVRSSLVFVPVSFSLKIKDIYIRFNISSKYRLSNASAKVMLAMI